jgi:UDP-N-acetylmuramoyl-tripeptide--D-alanyl-D-alanine ligase
MANIHHSEVRYTPNTLVRTAEHICSKRPVIPRIILNQAKPSAIPRATPPFTQQTSHANPKQSYPRTSSAKRHNKLIMDAHNANPTSRSVALNNFRDMEVPHKMGIGGDMLELGFVSQSAHQAVTNQLS